MTEAKNPWLEERHFRRDAIRGSRKLLTALMRLQGVYLDQRRKRSRAYKRVVAGLFERNPKVAKFEAATAAFYGLRPEDLHTPSRLRKFARPRQVVMYLAKTHGNASYPEIGKHFGKDHTTALHACRVVRSNGQLAADVEAIRQQLVANTQEERLAA
jgi:chromosomal replication initiator protein